MSRLVVIAVTLFAEGCTYQAGVARGPEIDAHLVDSAAIDDSVVQIDSAVQIDAPPLPLVCQVPDTNGVVLCLELEDPGLVTAQDLSGHSHDAMISNTAVAARDVPTTSQAAQITTNSTISVPDSNDFNTQVFTLMAWIRREATPAQNTAYGLIDVELQYQMNIDDQNRLGCTFISGNFVLGVAGPVVNVNEWTYAGCTYDGAQVCSLVFRGPSGAGTKTCSNQNRTVNTQSTAGIAVGRVATQVSGTTGVHFNGKLDAVRVFTRAMTEQQVCLAGGRTGC